MITVLVALAALLIGPQLLAVPAQAQTVSWQQHMAQANSFYRNRLLPKALAELKEVVKDPQGAKQLKPWQLMADIAATLKDLDTLIWSLEKGREVAVGQDKAQMQAQLYRLKRLYGRIVFEVAGGSGKLPNRGLKIKAQNEITDPAVKAYYERARGLFEEEGYSRGSYYLPANTYELEGEQIKVSGGKDVIIEVAPTSDVTFGIEVLGVLGGRAGEVNTGAAGFLGGLSAGVGPHIRFASGTALFVNLGPIALFGAQSTSDIQQNLYTPDQRARLSVGGFIEAGVEVKLGPIELGPRLGYAIQAMPSGMYYSGKVVSSPGDDVTPGLLEGQFIVPAVAHGPRLGLHVLLTPSIVKTRKVPRLFAGFKAGPLWAQPLWGGEIRRDSSVGVQQGSINPDAGLSEQEQIAAEEYSSGGFTVQDVTAGTSAGNALPFVDIQAVIGVQVRL